MNNCSTQESCMQPNTFIVGAPKCGTTTLAFYLANHPFAFVCDPKEPNYWSFDHVSEADYNGRDFKTEQDYLALFENARVGIDRVVCDASTSYIWSDVAIRRIYERFPEARFILLLRNPAELSLSLYREERHSFSEDQQDIWAAWALQEGRARGRQIPKTCKEPKKLQYRKIASVGSHAVRFQNIVPAERRMILLLDDLISDPARIWKDVQEFLGLPDDGRREFPVVNVAKTHRYPALAKALLRPGRVSAPFFNALRRIVWAAGLKGLRSGLVRRVSQHGDIDKSHDAAIIKALLPEFEGEIQLLEEATGRDLAHWRRKYA